MVNATSVHSTTRRAALIGVAAAALPSAASALPIPSMDEPDPIFRAIEAHKRACAEHIEAVHRFSVVDDRYSDQSRGWWSYSHYDRDPPEMGPEPADWIAAHVAMRDSHEAITATAIAAFATKPTTISGISAVLDYIMEPEFPSEHATPDDISWEHTVLGGGFEMTADDHREAAYNFLCNLGDALRAILATNVLI